MNDYINKASKEVEFLFNTMLAGEKVYTPGDKEFDDYVEGVKSLDDLINSNRKLEHEFDISNRKETNNHEAVLAKIEAEKEVKMKDISVGGDKESNRHEEETLKIEYERNNKYEEYLVHINHEQNRHEEEMTKIENEKNARMEEQLLNEEKERNRHEEEMYRINKEAKDSRRSKVASALAGIAKVGLYTAGITIICFSEETRIISKTALEFAKAAIRL